LKGFRKQYRDPFKNQDFSGQPWAGDFYDWLSPGN